MDARKTKQVAKEKLNKLRNLLNGAKNLSRVKAVKEQLQRVETVLDKINTDTGPAVVDNKFNMNDIPQNYELSEATSTLDKLEAFIPKIDEDNNDEAYGEINPAFERQMLIMQQEETKNLNYITAYTGDINILYDDSLKINREIDNLNTSIQSSIERFNLDINQLALDNKNKVKPLSHMDLEYEDIKSIIEDKINPTGIVYKFKAVENKYIEFEMMYNNMKPIIADIKNLKDEFDGLRKKISSPNVIKETENKKLEIDSKKKNLDAEVVMLNTIKSEIETLRNDLRLAIQQINIRIVNARNINLFITNNELYYMITDEVGISRIEDKKDRQDINIKNYKTNIEWLVTHTGSNSSHGDIFMDCDAKIDTTKDIWNLDIKDPASGASISPDYKCNIFVNKMKSESKNNSCLCMSIYGKQSLYDDISTKYEHWAKDFLMPVLKNILVFSAEIKNGSVAIYVDYNLLVAMSNLDMSTVYKISSDFKNLYGTSYNENVAKTIDSFMPKIEELEKKSFTILDYLNAAIDINNIPHIIFIYTTRDLEVPEIGHVIPYVALQFKDLTIEESTFNASPHLVWRSNQTIISKGDIEWIQEGSKLISPSEKDMYIIERTCNIKGNWNTYGVYDNGASYDPERYIGRLSQSINSNIHSGLDVYKDTIKKLFSVNKSDGILKSVPNDHKGKYLMAMLIHLFLTSSVKNRVFMQNYYDIYNSLYGDPSKLPGYYKCDSKVASVYSVGNAAITAGIAAAFAEKKKSLTENYEINMPEYLHKLLNISALKTMYKDVALYNIPSKYFMNTYVYEKPDKIYSDSKTMSTYNDFIDGVYKLKNETHSLIKIDGTELKNPDINKKNALLYNFNYPNILCINSFFPEICKIVTERKSPFLPTKTIDNILTKFSLDSHVTPSNLTKYFDALIHGKIKDIYTSYIFKPHVRFPDFEQAIETSEKNSNGSEKDLIDLLLSFEYKGGTIPDAFASEIKEIKLQDFDSNVDLLPAKKNAILVWYTLLKAGYDIDPNRMQFSASYSRFDNLDKLSKEIKEIKDDKAKITWTYFAVYTLKNGYFKTSSPSDEKDIIAERDRIITEMKSPSPSSSIPPNYIITGGKEDTTLTRNDIMIGSAIAAAGVGYSIFYGVRLVSIVILIIVLIYIIYKIYSESKKSSQCTTETCAPETFYPMITTYS